MGVSHLGDDDDDDDDDYETLTASVLIPPKPITYVARTTPRNTKMCTNGKIQVRIE